MLATARSVTQSFSFIYGCRSDLNLAAIEKNLLSFFFGSIRTCFVDLNMNITLETAVSTTRPRVSTEANIQAERSAVAFCCWMYGDCSAPAAPPSSYGLLPGTRALLKSASRTGLDSTAGGRLLDFTIHARIRTTRVRAQRGVSQRLNPWTLGGNMLHTGQLPRKYTNGRVRLFP